MWYRYEIEVPAGTTALRPERHEIGIPAGVITGVRVRFPPGPRGLVSIGIFQGTHKMWPRGYETPTGVPDRPGPPAWYRGDNEWIAWNEHVPNIEGWHWFLVGFAPATAYPHTVFVDIFILETEYAETWGPIQELVKTLKDLIGL